MPRWVLDNYQYIRVITKLPNSEQSYKGKVKTHNYINRQNQSTTGNMPRWLLDKYPYDKMTARLSMCQGDC